MEILTNDKRVFPGFNGLFKDTFGMFTLQIETNEATQDSESIKYGEEIENDNLILEFELNSQESLCIPKEQPVEPNIIVPKV